MDRYLVKKPIINKDLKKFDSKTVTLEEMKAQKIPNNIDFNHRDFKLGQYGEKKVFTKFKAINPKIEKLTAFYSPFDFCIKNENGEVTALIELKTRTIDLNTYPTLGFGYNKLNYACKFRRTNNNRKIRIIVCWLLNDGELYFWEYFDNQSHREFTVETGRFRNVAQNQKASKSVMVKTEFIKKFNYHNILSAK